MSVTSKPCLEILPAENGFILRPSHDPNSSPRRDGGYHVFETFDSMVRHLRKAYGEEAPAPAEVAVALEREYPTAEVFEKDLPKTAPKRSFLAGPGNG